MQLHGPCLRALGPSPRLRTSAVELPNPAAHEEAEAAKKGRSPSERPKSREETPKVGNGAVGEDDTMDLKWAYSFFHATPEPVCGQYDVYKMHS